MSDRRSHEERCAAIAEVRKALNAYEAESGGHDLDANLRYILERLGFGEAWATTMIVGKLSELLVLLRVENTESPQFILMRQRENGYGMAPQLNQEFSWGVYTWVPGT